MTKANLHRPSTGLSRLDRACRPRRVAEFSRHGHHPRDGIQAVIFQAAVQANSQPVVLARVTAIDLLGSERGQPIATAAAGLGHDAGVVAWSREGDRVCAVAGDRNYGTGFRPAAVRT